MVILGPHEALETHEVLNFKTMALMQAKLFQGLVMDDDLRALIQKDVPTIDESDRGVAGLLS